MAGKIDGAFIDVNVFIQLFTILDVQQEKDQKVKIHDYVLIIFSQVFD